MAGYAKSWTDKFNDSWYVSLRLNERGMFDQLYTYAKLHGDVGKIFLRNFAHAGAEYGCDRDTAAKILRKFANDGKVILKEKENGIEIVVRNYKYWQRDKKVGDGEKPSENQGKSNGKSPLKISRADKRRDIYSPAKNSQDIASDKIPYQGIIQDLNRKAKKNYRADSKDTKTRIRILWKQGFRLDDFKKVHFVKAAEWVDDPERNIYLRPSTLYQTGKFEGYLNQTVQGERQKTAEELAVEKERREFDEELKKRKEGKNE